MSKIFIILLYGIKNTKRLSYKGQNVRKKRLFHIVNFLGIRIAQNLGN